MPDIPTTRDHYFESEPLASTIAYHDSKVEQYDEAPLRGDFPEPVGDTRDELMDDGPDEPYCED